MLVNIINIIDTIMYGTHGLEEFNAGSIFMGGNSSHHFQL